jgi:hypothetical protein
VIGGGRQRATWGSALGLAAMLLLTAGSSAHAQRPEPETAPVAAVESDRREGLISASAPTPFHTISPQAAAPDRQPARSRD